MRINGKGMELFTGWDQVCRHGCRTKGSRLNSLGGTEDFRCEYDLSDFGKISQVTSRGTWSRKVRGSSQRPTKRK